MYVTVDNLGTVYEGKSKSKALKTFRWYRKVSLFGQGRIGGQPVHLIDDDGTVLREVHPVRWEVTDTFGGESNYSWVDKGVALTQAQAVREVRKRIPRSRVVLDCGDMLELRHSRICRVGFIYKF